MVRRIVEVDRSGQGPLQRLVFQMGLVGRPMDESIQPHLTHTDDWRRLKVGDAWKCEDRGEPLDGQGLREGGRRVSRLGVVAHAERRQLAGRRRSSSASWARTSGRSG